MAPCYSTIHDLVGEMPADADTDYNFAERMIDKVMTIIVLDDIY